MSQNASRGLYALAAIGHAFGGYGHTSAYDKAVAAVAQSDLPEFYREGLKVLWLTDSATIFLVSASFALLAIWPRAAARPVVVLIALSPISTAALLYHFVGTPSYVFLSFGVGVLAILASLLDRPSRV
jgi:hypothetical protein